MLLSDAWRLTYVCRVYIGPKSRTEMHRKTKIGTEVYSPRHTWLGQHFQGQKVKDQLAGVWHIVAASSTACWFMFQLVSLLKHEHMYLSVILHEEVCWSSYKTKPIHLYPRVVLPSAVFAVVRVSVGSSEQTILWISSRSICKNNIHGVDLLPTWQ